MSAPVRMWAKSACIVLAWDALLITVVAGVSRSHPAQVNNRIAASASSTAGITLAATLSVAAVPVKAVSPARRYAVQPGDFLSGIAARLAVRGGWLTLYTANQRVIGTGQDVIRPGTVLAIPRSAGSRPGWSPGRRVYLPRPPAMSAVSGQRPWPARARLTGMPPWLTTLLLASGMLIGAAFLAEPLLAARRRAAGSRAALVSSGPAAGGGGGRARIVMADYDRLVVTHSTRDGAVFVLRPPGAEPAAVLRVARLVLPEDSYGELADQLGVPASWPVE